MHKHTKNHNESDSAFISEARERARDGHDFWSENWELAKSDLTFLSGEQWEEEVRNERELEQRPCVTNNVLPAYVDQIIGDQRQNRPSFKINPVDTVNKKIKNIAGTQDYDLALTLSSIIRNIEYNSNAKNAYDYSFQASVESGIGFLRVRTDYLHEKSFEQDILIEHIPNQFSVVLDPHARKPDYSDANWCFIHDKMRKEEFQRLYPDVSPEPINEMTQGNDTISWFDDKSVTVSEYFVREEVVKELALLSDGRSVYLNEIKNILDELSNQGITVKKTRKSKTHKVTWYKICGNAILEGPIVLGCTMIPVFPVFGKSITIGKQVIYRSLIRYAKDAQRMLNYWDSAAIETVALAPKAPFIGSEDHIEGREKEWQTANTTNRAILVYKSSYDGDQGPRRANPAITPNAEITMSLQMADKIKSTIGMFDASLGNVSNETSGKAILARQRQGDRGSFVFIDNLNKAIENLGKCIIELIPLIYDTERVARLKFEDETEDFVLLNQLVLDEESQEWIVVNDISVGKCDVRVTSGPSFTTQRIESAEAMMQFAQAVPNAAALIGDLIALNMDWTNADVIAKRLKKSLPPNMLTNDERQKIQEEAGPQEPDPSQQAMMQIEKSKIEAELAKSQAIQTKAQSEIQLAQIRLQQAQAMPGMNQQQAPSEYDKLLEDARNNAEIAKSKAIEHQANIDLEIAKIKLREAAAKAASNGVMVDDIVDYSSDISNQSELIEEQVKNYTAQAIAEFIHSQELQAQNSSQQQQQNKNSTQEQQENIPMPGGVGENSQVEGVGQNMPDPNMGMETENTIPQDILNQIPSMEELQKLPPEQQQQLMQEFQQLPPEIQNQIQQALLSQLPPEQQQ